MNNKSVALLSIVVVLSLVLLIGERFYKSPPLIAVINHGKVADPSFDGFKEGMNELGYIEDKDIRYYYEGATNNLKSLPAMADKLIDMEPTIILALSTPAAIAVKNKLETRSLDIPILFAPSSNPVKAGLVKSILEPGGPITGVTFGIKEDKRLQWLTRINKSIQNIYIPHLESDQSAVAFLKKLEETETDQAVR